MLAQIFKPVSFRPRSSSMFSVSFLTIQDLTIYMAPYSRASSAEGHYKKRGDAMKKYEMQKTACRKLKVEGPERGKKMYDLKYVWRYYLA